jgi:hypothetical protein
MNGSIELSAAIQQRIVLAGISVVHRLMSIPAFLRASVRWQCHLR